MNDPRIADAVPDFSDWEMQRRQEFSAIWNDRLPAVFADVAPYYGIASNVASLGLCNVWRRQFVSFIDAGPGDRVLDVCAGTNWVGIGLLRRQPDLRVVALDRSAAMQAVGDANARSLGFRIESVINDAHKLPFPDNSFDVVSLQWASRHLRVVEAFTEIMRVLKPGGRFYHSDMLRPESRLVGALYSAYLKACVSVTALVFRSGSDAWHCRDYFVRAIEKFYSAAELTGLLRKIGFSDVTERCAPGGILACHRAVKAWRAPPDWEGGAGSPVARCDNLRADGPMRGCYDPRSAAHCREAESVTDRPTTEPAALTPAALAGLALRPLPAAALRPLTDLAFAAMRRRHPGVFARLADLGEDAVLIDPVDLPFAFVLRPGSDRPTLVPVRKPVTGGGPPPCAAIRGPLAMLIDLAEGRIDGDAVFFSRALSVEGDASAVVTLRNALESAEIDVLGDVLSALGPFAPAARGAAGLGLALLGRAAADLDALRSALLAPLTRRFDDQATAVRALADRVAAAPEPAAPGRGRAAR